MMTQILMPQLGESVSEGTILRWMKRPGDLVRRDEPIVEIMTDKVNVEIPSTVAGLMAALLVEEGAVVPVGAPIAEVDEVGQRAESGRLSAGLDRSSANAVEGPPAGRAAFSPRSAGISPVVRKLADDHGVDLASIVGSGIGGRVTKQDVLAYVERTRPSGDAGSGDSRIAIVATGSMSTAGMRRTIAAHLLQSHRDVPAAWTMQEVDVTQLVQLRSAARDDFKRRFGFDLSYLPFTLQAVVESIRQMPILNSRWENERITFQQSINVGIAVALDEGLVVPVVHRAETMGFADLARTSNDLIGRARNGLLGVQDVRGGTFTVNNTGAFGSIVSVPLINTPEAAILTMEAIVKRPVVVGDDVISVRSMMNICLSFDHRVVDGAVAGKFLGLVRSCLEGYQSGVPFY